MTTWQLQDAKARLSEVVKAANREGPQEVTVRGEPSAVILSVEEYKKLQRQQPDFVSFMQSSPLTFEDVDMQRNDSLTRDIVL